MHSSSIIDNNVKIGDGTRVWHWVHICENAQIGKGCSIGQNVFVGNNTVIGQGCKIQNNVSVYDNVVLEDYVFCGPSVVFTNVINPRSEVERKSEYRSTMVRKGATLGANSTIVCGNEIGKYAFIGAGSVVTKNIKPYAVVIGSPARQIGWITIEGKRLDLPNETVKPLERVVDNFRYTLNGSNLVCEKI